MGEIADSMINGEFDYITGEYIGKPVGYPRSNENRIHFRKRGKRFKNKNFTENQKVKGVMFYLYDKGHKNPQEAHGIIYEFCIFAGIVLPDKRKIVFACGKIQENFPIFLNWYNARHK